MSIVIGMSVGHGAAREIERKLSGLKALYVHLEQEEGLADSAAFRTEERLKRLGRQKKNEDQDFAEARLWLDSLAQGGTAGLCMNKHRVEQARGMIRMIHSKTVRICQEARGLHERLQHYRAMEESCEAAGYALADAIEQLERDLAGLNP